MTWILDRLSEPSSYAGFAALAGSIGVSAPMYQHVAAAAVGVFGLVAFIVHEKKAA